MTDAAYALSLAREAERRFVLPSTRYIPHAPHPRQAEFRAMRDVFEALYGGAAGGGKSDEGLAEALEYCHIPGFSAAIFRRTFPMLEQSDGLIPRSIAWGLRDKGGVYNASKHVWTFPTGGAPARLQFGHLQHEATKFLYQGGAYQYLFFDELTHFTESQYLYLHSRVRRPGEASDALSRVPLRVRSGSNPGGIGHKWVKKRFVDEKTRAPGVVFFPARLRDNPTIDATNYVRALSNLSETERRQLLDGDWILEWKGQIYPYGPENLIESLPLLDERIRLVLGIDLGSSEKNPTTAMVIVAYHPDFRCAWVMHAECWPGMTPTTLGERSLELETRFGGFERVVVDQGGLGDSFIRELQQRFKVPAQRAMKAGKLGFRKLIRDALQPVAPVGSEIIPPPSLFIVEPACAALLEEMADLQWNEAGDDCAADAPDHLTDALLYAWRACYAWAQTPPPTLPAAPQPDREAEEWRRRDIEAAARKRKRKWWQRRTSISIASWGTCAVSAFVDFGRRISSSSSTSLPPLRAA